MLGVILPLAAAILQLVGKIDVSGGTEIVARYGLGGKRPQSLVGHGRPRAPPEEQRVEADAAIGCSDQLARAAPPLPHDPVDRPRAEPRSASEDDHARLDV